MYHRRNSRVFSSCIKRLPNRYGPTPSHGSERCNTGFAECFCAGKKRCVRFEVLATVGLPKSRMLSVGLVVNAAAEDSTGIQASAISVESANFMKLECLVSLKWTIDLVAKF